jgi:hypothetical protein
LKRKQWHLCKYLWTSLLLTPACYFENKLKLLKLYTWYLY